MRRFIRIAVLTATVFAATPVLADPPPGDSSGECQGGLCGTPDQSGFSFWDQLLAWLGLD